MAGLSPATTAPCQESPCLEYFGFTASISAEKTLIYVFRLAPITRQKTKTPTGSLIGYRSGFLINPFSRRSTACFSSPVSEVLTIIGCHKLNAARLNRWDKRRRADYGWMPLACEHRVVSAVFEMFAKHVRLVS